MSNNQINIHGQKKRSTKAENFKDIDTKAIDNDVELIRSLWVVEFDSIDTGP